MVGLRNLPHADVPPVAGIRVVLPAAPEAGGAVGRAHVLLARAGVGEKVDPSTDESAAHQATGTFFNALNGEENSMKPGKGGSPAERRISRTFLSCFRASWTQARNADPQTKRSLSL